VVTGVTGDGGTATTPVVVAVDMATALEAAVVAGRVVVADADDQGNVVGGFLPFSAPAS